MRTPQARELLTLAATAGATVRDDGDGQLIVTGLDPARLGDLAFENRIRLHELAPVAGSLEDAFMELTADSVEYRGAENEQGEPGHTQPGQAQPPAQEQLVAQGQRGSEGGS